MVASFFCHAKLGPLCRGCLKACVLNANGGDGNSQRTTRHFRLKKNRKEETRWKEAAALELTREGLFQPGADSCGLREYISVPSTPKYWNNKSLAVTVVDSEVCMRRVMVKQASHSGDGGL